jgi:putative membrane protein
LTAARPSEQNGWRSPRGQQSRRPRFTTRDARFMGREVLWIKAFHIVFMVTWFAGLFYLPRLFVYHALSEDAASRERFKVMERRLYYGIMTPGGALTVLFGLVLWLGYGITGGWLHAKLALVAALVAYHLWCGKLLNDFKHERNIRSHVWYRWFNEVPTVILVAVVILAVVKPF